MPKATVEERATAQLSPMPANLAEQIAEAEFYDLMDYLLRHREKKHPSNVNGSDDTPVSIGSQG